MKLQSLFPFMNWLPNVTKGSLRADLLAAITGAVIVLPQGVAYAFIAGMPPEYGLYSAMIVSVLASMFGSSKHMITGPAAAISIVVMSAASGYSTSGAMTPDFISTVITLTFMVGAIQLAMGLARLGNLVNFISHTVVIGFTSGAAILIAASQLKHLFGIPVPDGLSFIAGLEVVLSELGDINPYSLAIGLSTLISAILVKKFLRGWPHLLIGMLVGSVVCFVLDGEQQGIALVGALPGTLPPFGLPDLSLESLSALGSGAFAIALLGLIEAVSIARAIAVRSGQRIQGNQEFIGQGLGNFIGSFFSCFAGSGSFTRSGANYDAGAQTPLAAVMAAGFLVLVVLFLPDLTRYLPLSAMAGTVLLIAWNLFDLHHMKEIFHASKQERLVFIVTFASTLLVKLEFAIYIGVFASMVLYLNRTCRPGVIRVAPIQNHPQRLVRNVARYDLSECPQMPMLRFDGSIYFGSVDHFQGVFRRYSKITESGNELIDEANRALLINARGINFIDLAGADMLVQETRRLEKEGIQLWITSLKGTVIDELKQSGHYDKIGPQHFIESTSEAIAKAVPQLDADVCARCPHKIFRECPGRG